MRQGDGFSGQMVATLVTVAVIAPFIALSLFVVVRIFCRRHRNKQQQQQQQQLQLQQQTQQHRQTQPGALQYHETSVRLVTGASAVQRPRQYANYTRRHSSRRIR